MSSALTTIETISDSILTYGVIALVVLGLIGNRLNILILINLRIFLNTPCAFCLFVESIANPAQMLTALWVGVYMDVLHSALVWCKLKNVAQQVFNMISFGTVCIAAFGQFLATNPRCNWRRLNSMKFIRCLIVVFLGATLLHSIPFLIFFEIDVSQLQPNGSSLFGDYSTRYS